MALIRAHEKKRESYDSKRMTKSRGHTHTQKVVLILCYLACRVANRPLKYGKGKMMRPESNQYGTLFVKGQRILQRPTHR